MYFEDEVQLPALIPIKAKKKKKEEEESPERAKEELSTEVITILAQAFDRQKEEREAKKSEKQSKPAMGPEKIEEIDRKFHNLQEKGSSKKEERSVRVNNYKERENQKSKHIITDLMKKIDAKNVAEELYPVTNEAMLGYIKEVDREVEELKVEAERKENSLITNPNNQHLKKELEILKVSIDRCVTIKELYNEKINLRNKVSILERTIIKLTEQNENLRIKNYREGEDQDNHANGLPCYRERELKDELAKCQLDLQKEKGMREKLENNINDIVQNFKRLYEEADTARLIVTRKLKDIQEKEKLMQYDPSSDSEKDSSEKKASPKLEVLDKKARTQASDDAAKTGRKMAALANPEARARDKERTFQKPLTLEDQILKMKGNQATIAKNQKR